MPRRKRCFHCFECSQPAKHAHHVVPYSKGGTRTVPLCEECHGKVHGINFYDHRKAVKEGLARARLNGKHLGRPKTRNDDEILKLRAEGRSFREIAKQLGISRTVAWAAVSEKKLCA